MNFKFYSIIHFLGNQNETEQIQIDATNAWGPETLFQFKYFDNGNYSLIPASTCTTATKYITCDGTCVDLAQASNSSKSVPKVNGYTNGNGNWINGSNGLSGLVPSKECLFTIEYHGGFIAFRDKSGRYLAATGRQAVLRTRSTSVGKDELFVFEPAPLQVAFRATFNNKWISIKQGKDWIGLEIQVQVHFTFMSVQHNS